MSLRFPKTLIYPLAGALALAATAATAAINVTITSPSNGASISPNNLFDVTVNATSSFGLSSLSVTLEGVEVQTINYGAFPPAVNETETFTFFLPSAVAGQELDITATGAGFAEDSQSNTISIIAGTPTPTPAPTPTPLPNGVVALNGHAADAVYDATRDMIYVIDRDNDNVDVVDVQAASISASIAVGDLPNGLALSSGDGQLLVANIGGQSISVIDVATQSISRTDDLSSVLDTDVGPLQIAYLGADQALVGVSYTGSGGERPLDYTPSTGAAVEITLPGVFGDAFEPHYVASSADQQVAILGEGGSTPHDLFIFDATTSITATAQFSGSVTNVAVNADGSLFIADELLLDADLNEVATLEHSQGAAFLSTGVVAALETDFTGTDYLHIMDASTGGVVFSYALPADTSSLAYVIPSGDLTANKAGGGTVMVVDPLEELLTLLTVSDTASAELLWKSYK
ncbi:MAG: hypothetical protein RLY93_16465 [Sumerlaeia bacterium]